MNMKIITVMGVLGAFMAAGGATRAQTPPTVAAQATLPNGSAMSESVSVCWDPVAIALAVCKQTPTTMAVTDTATASLQASNAGAGLSVAQKPTQSTPTDATTAITTTSTAFGTAGSYHAMTIQAQGQPMCVTFGSGTPSAPSSAGVCAVGMYLAAGQGFTFTISAVPSSQGKAAALATGGSLWESVQ